ncbi:MAG: hypothetical protein R6U68_17230 [Desulfobacteraceae bacterium]
MNFQPRYCEIATELCDTTRSEYRQRNQIFSAYSSHDISLVGQIEAAIKNLNKETDFQWISWPNDMEIENTLIFCEICKHIHQSKAVLVELSDLNFNVIFEYGYSLGLGKKIHPIVETGFNFKNVERFLYPLLGIGLGTYDRNKLSQKLRKKRFWEKKAVKTAYHFGSNNLLKDDYRIEANSILYIKNVDDSSVSDEIEKELVKSSTNLIVDDAQEENYNIIWYSKQIKRSFGVIIDLGMSSKTDNMKHFLKCAFIAGISVATGRRTLIINSVHAEKPSDIITLVKEYNSPKNARRMVASYLDKHANILSMINTYIDTLHRDRLTVFDKIDLGEHVAVNDLFFIKKCFVEIPEYKILSRPGYKLIIGRKGTGKSAAFFHFKQNNNRKNEIVIHQLFDKYNLNDLYTITEWFPDIDEKNKIATAFWTFVLLSIIAHKIKRSIDEDTDPLPPETEELNKSFIDFFDSTEMFCLEKNITEQVLELLDEIKKKNAKNIKQIQADFYSNAIIQLKEFVVDYFLKSDKTLYFNIDGLDANLDLQKNKKIISLILYNLHEVCCNLLGHLVDKYSINLFLRTDLYLAFKDKITEKDKITKAFFNWNEEYLFQLINYRLSENDIRHIADLLDDSFNIDTLTKKMRRYVYERPRDYIYIFNNFIQIAQSLKKDKIDTKVFNESLDYYTRHINESLEAEFLSLQYEITYSELLTSLKASLIKDKRRLRVKKFIQLLEQMDLTEDDIHAFLLFLLQIKFILLYHDNKPIEWNKLSDPNLKLKQILKASHNRYFYFPDIIQKIIDELF